MLFPAVEVAVVRHRTIWAGSRDFIPICALHGRVIFPHPDFGILADITGGDLMSGSGDQDLLALAEKADRAAMVAQGQIAKQYWQGIAKEYRARAAGELNPGRAAIAIAESAGVSLGSSQSLRGLKDLEQPSEAKWYRLYLKDRGGETVGRADFETSDDADPLIIAKIVLHACSDVACGYELWAKDKFVDSSTEPLGPTDLQENHRKIIADMEIGLRDSAWLVARSRKLLEEIEKLTGG